jgi:hypothetical protein
VRILRTIWADILYINSQLELAVKVFGLIISAALIVASWYIGKDWWNVPVNITRLVIAGVFGATVIACYVVSVIIRSRRPLLIVGDLRPDVDDTRQNCFFQMRVENRGPGTIEPIVKVTYLRDAAGRLLPSKSSYLGEEIHWRYFTHTDRTKQLRDGDEAYAGVFWLHNLDSDEPELMLYPLDLVPRQVTKPAKLLDNPGLRVKIIATYKASDLPERDTPVIKRSYLITPAPSEPLRFKVRRVRFASLFWR